jgi:murein DD-endopeptidase MepM/ murein hydrolase activator NlpD
MKQHSQWRNMMSSTIIFSSVGASGSNQYLDVKRVQQLLIENSIPLKGGADGRCGPYTIQAIKKFQTKFMKNPDGRVDPSGTTWKRLTNKNLVTPNVGAPADAAVLKPVAVTANLNIGGAQFFPLAVSAAADWNDGMRKFGYGRSKVNGIHTRSHAGCDLYVAVGKSIYAVADGVVMDGPRSFYDGTDFIAIDHGDFTILYGEIKSGSSSFRKGDKVKAGQKIAQVGKLKNISQSMLHLEMYDNTATGALLLGKSVKGKVVNGRPTHRRDDLIDPAPKLSLWNHNKPTATADD